MKIVELFYRTTSTFKTVKISLRQTKIKKIGYDREILVGTLHATKGNLIYGFLNYGTGPRTIVSVPPRKVMRFQRGYTPATWRTRALKPGEKSRHGDWVSTRVVKDHRIDPRRFDKAIVKHRMGYFKKTMITRMKKRAREFWI